MKQVDLKEILNKVYDEKYRSNYKTEYSEKCILEAMQEACNQTINLCAENAVVEVVDHEELYISSLPGYDRDTEEVILPIYGVDDKSILDTKKQII